MQSFLIFIAYLIYNTVIFFIPTPILFIPFLVINLISTAVLRVPLKKHLLFLLKSLPFVLFIALSNLVFELISVNFLVPAGTSIIPFVTSTSAAPFAASLPVTIFHSIYITIRLILAVDISYLISFYFSPDRLQRALTIFFYPLKLFKIDTRELSIITAVALTFIPILTNEAKTLKLSLRAHGFDPTLKNIVKNPGVFVNTFLDNIFDRTEALATSLKLKAY